MKTSLAGSLNIRLVAILLLIALPATITQAQIDFALEEGAVTEVVETAPQWEGSFAAGLNGKSGNSENLDINFALNLTRDTDFATTNLLANYFYASNDVATTTDRWFSQFRQERKLSNPRLSWYYQLGVEIDRFKDFDYRIALHSGLAYKIIDEELRKLKIRMGAGASKEVGSVNDDWLPELQFGADWERKLSETTRIYTSVDFFPNVSDFSDYRLLTNSGLDFLLDAERNINFRLFAQNRYDSTPPPGNQENDIDYGAALVVGF